MGLPPAAATLHRHVLPDQVRPSAVLSGRDETTGQFRTAGAKEYPPGFCAALVHTLLGGLAARHCKESLRVVQWSQLEERDRDWITAVELASSRCISSHFLPDYQPH